MVNVLTYQNHHFITPLSLERSMYKTHPFPTLDMTNECERGYHRLVDFTRLLADSKYHDVTLVCSDGVEIGACRAILASRSDVFDAMLYGSMREANSNKVNFGDIKSDVMEVILRFIYTEEIDLFTNPSMNEVYLAANFLLLHGLTKLVLDRYIVICDGDEHPNSISFEPIPYALAEMVLDALDAPSSTKNHIIDNLVLTSLRIGSVSEVLMDHEFRLDNTHGKWIEKADDTSATVKLAEMLADQESVERWDEWVNEQVANPGGAKNLKKRRQIDNAGENAEENFQKPVKNGRFPKLVGNARLGTRSARLVPIIKSSYLRNKGRPVREDK